MLKILRISSLLTMGILLCIGITKESKNQESSLSILELEKNPLDIDVSEIIRQHREELDFTSLDFLELSSAWRVSTGSSDVKVGIIDTGIDYSHSDLCNHFNSYYSKSFIENKYDCFDNVGHGTAVAGIIGGDYANETGIFGICQSVDMISYKVLNDKELKGKIFVPEAIMEAEKNGVKILNISLKCRGNSELEARMINAIKNYSGIIIFAAGNEGENIDDLDACGYFDLPNVITVGAMNDCNFLHYLISNGNYSFEWNHSNYGKKRVDIYAPGCPILTSSPNESICLFEGTSAAAPFVTGTAALLMSAYPAITPSEIKATIIKNAVYHSELVGRCSSEGYLNIGACLNHPHSHRFKFNQKNVFCHSLICDCGYSKEENHIWIKYKMDTYKCKKCGMISRIIPTKSDISNFQLKSVEEYVDNDDGIFLYKIVFIDDDIKVMEGKHEKDI